jgi:hypothetical protein
MAGMTSGVTRRAKAEHRETFVNLAPSDRNGGSYSDRKNCPGSFVAKATQDDAAHIFLKKVAKPPFFANS